MMLNFTRQGKLKAFSATGSVDMTEKREAGNEKRYIQGDSMMIEEGRKVALNVKGGEGIPAAIVSGGYKIEAGEINVLMNSNNLEATGGIKVTIDPIHEKQSKVGFFQEEASIFLVANEMRYSGDAKRFLFKDRVKIWQGKDMVLTEELALFRDTGKILCSRGVASFIAFSPKAEDADYQVGIEAESLTFNPEESLIAYQENSSLKVKDINLHADSLLVFLNKDTGRMQKITARGNVSIQRNEYEGLGQEAIYDIEEEKVVLTGSPVLMDKTRGRTEGDKLTFHISDGRIIVENKGRERSVSVIKS
jgi:lipopolysaccharide transport protein LptA